MPAARAETVSGALARVAQRCGTPTYAYDLVALRRRVRDLRRSLPEAVDVYYSVKANPSLVLCSELAELDLGGEVVSAGELEVALTAGVPPERIVVGGPYKPPQLLDRLRQLPEAWLSVDSVDELEHLAPKDLPHRLLLRLRPDFEARAAVSMGRTSRFGIPREELHRCRSVLAAGGARVQGFHVYFGSQVLDGGRLALYLRQSLELCLRAADEVGVEPRLLDLGGGFGVPYAPTDPELDLGPVAEELARAVAVAAPARTVLELGRYLVAPAGWYLTSVVGLQRRDGRRVVIVDGGTHQRADLCGLDLPRRSAAPLVLGAAPGPATPAEVAGCLCLPDDLLAVGCSLPAVAQGDLLAFPNAGAYGLTASPALFLSHPLPGEATFEGERIEVVSPSRPSAPASRPTQGSAPSSPDRVAASPALTEMTP